MAVHTLWIAIYVAAGHEARDFVHIGLYWVAQSRVSDDIVYDPTYEYPRSHGAASSLPGARLRGYCRAGRAIVT